MVNNNLSIRNKTTTGLIKLLQKSKNYTPILYKIAKIQKLKTQIANVHVKNVFSYSF